MRLMMDNQKKYDEEQFFLTKGFRCKEVEEGFPANFVSKAYGLVSGYGTSLLRPALGLGVLWALGWLLLAPLVCLNNAEPVGMQTSCGMGMGFVSFSNLFGFLALWRGILEDEVALLSCSGWAEAVAGVQMVVGPVLIFLLLLGMRNRFRMR